MSKEEAPTRGLHHRQLLLSWNRRPHELTRIQVRLVVVLGFIKTGEVLL
jgi:hypothetical protein